METARPVPIQWIPEDDLLLKNAVEAGASLEALAKGAVQFSRRFSLHELRERWCSLLYDPDISAQASTGIFELEISGVSPLAKLYRSDNSFTGNRDVSQKRKSESIRKKYYAMRKKFRTEFLNNTDLGFLESNPHEFSGQSAGFEKQVTLDGNPLGQNCMVGHRVSDHIGLEEEDLDILLHAFPETIRDIAMASGTNNLSQTGCPSSFQDNRQDEIMGRSYVFDGNATTSLAEGGNSVLEVNIKNGNPLTLKHSAINENPQNASVGFEGRQQFNSSNSGDFANYQTIVLASNQSHLRHWRTAEDVSAPDNMFQGTGQVTGDLLRDDVEGKGNSSAACTSEFADPDSLLNLSNDYEILLTYVDEDHAENKTCPDSDINSVFQDFHKHGQETDVAEVQLDKMSVSEEVTNPSVNVDQQLNLQPEVNLPSTSVSNSNFDELSGGKICCTLNTEDTEIPCNDDIFLLIHPSTSFGSSTQPNSTSCIDVSTAAHEKNKEQAVNLSTKAKDSTKVFEWPPKVGIRSIPELHSAKIETQDPRPTQGLPGFRNKPFGDSSKGKSSYGVPKVSSDRLVEKDVGVSAMSKQDGHGPTTASDIRFTEAGSGRLALQEPVVGSSGSDKEESDIDDDVPYFSDVEAMILGMDLDPYDEDSHVIRQVPSYQYDDTKRTIIRLEQGARSCLQRAMTSQGALAILYGRHLRHYIKKPEVLLGRSTDDLDVDIDLRKEGRANKVSRRQAIIKMEADGSFSLKNLGKSSVAVNGTEVATGQLLNLSSSCLIEIKGMSFVFEINQGYVRKHLGNLCLKNGGKNEWTAKDEP